MDEVQKLREQVGKLQRRLDQIEGVGAEQAAVAELVSDGDPENMPRRTGFARAVEKSNAEHRQQLEEKAIRELKECHLSTPQAIRSFRDLYVPTLGRDRVDELINTYDPDGRR